MLACQPGPVTTRPLQKNSYTPSRPPRQGMPRRQSHEPAHGATRAAGRARRPVLGVDMSTSVRPRPRVHALEERCDVRPRGLRLHAGLPVQLSIGAPEPGPRATSWSSGPASPSACLLERMPPRGPPSPAQGSLCPTHAQLARRHRPRHCMRTEARVGPTSEAQANASLASRCSAAQRDAARGDAVQRSAAQRAPRRPTGRRRRRGKGREGEERSEEGWDRSRALLHVAHTSAASSCRPRAARPATPGPRPPSAAARGAARGGGVRRYVVRAGHGRRRRRARMFAPAGTDGALPGWLLLLLEALID
eukprot:scaffold833_cov259-Prasinococcus_capsulatus_cf.AAC.7